MVIRLGPFPPDCTGPFKDQGSATTYLLVVFPACSSSWGMIKLRCPPLPIDLLN